MRAIMGLSVIIPLVGTVGWAETPLPLFTAFKQICIETNAQPVAALAAAKAMGAIEEPQLPTTAGIRLTSWHLDNKDRRLSGDVGTIEIPAQDGKLCEALRTCTVLSIPDDGGSVDELRSWAPVEPSDRWGGMTVYRYRAADVVRRPATKAYVPLPSGSDVTIKTAHTPGKYTLMTTSIMVPCISKRDQ